MAQEVPDEAAGPVDGRPGAGKAAQDVLVDVGGGVAGVEPSGGEVGEFVTHAGRDVAKGGGEQGEGADEGAGVFRGRRRRRRWRRVGGLGRPGRKVGGVFPRLFVWMTVGGRGGWLTGGRCGGTRWDLRGYGVGAGGGGCPGEKLDGLIGRQRGVGHELLGGPAPPGDLDPPLVHEPFFLQLALGAGEGVSPDPGTLGGGGEGLARTLGEGELPGEEPDGVGTEPRMPDELVRELGEGARGRVKVPVDHRWLLPLVVQALADGCNRRRGPFCVNVQHEACRGGHVE